MGALSHSSLPKEGEEGAGGVSSAGLLAACGGLITGGVQGGRGRGAAVGIGEPACRAIHRPGGHMGALGGRGGEAEEREGAPGVRLEVAVGEGGADMDEAV